MLLLKNAKIFPVSNEPFIGDVAIDGKKIVAIGKNLDYTGADVFDLTGCCITPGFVDAHCHIGMIEDAIGFEGTDVNECSDPLTPALRAIDAINPFDRCFKDAMKAGVTTVLTGPGSANVIGGTFVALKLSGGTVEDMILKEPIAMKAAFGENPKGVYADQKKSPMTRMAIASILRKALFDTKQYIEKKEKAEKDKLFELNFALEPLIPVLKGEIPLKIHCHRADDILTAIRIANEFGIKYTLDHCTEGYLIPDEIKAALKGNLIGIIIGPLLSDRSKVELKNLTFEAPRILYENGIDFAMMTDSPVIPEQYLSVCASIAVKEGLPEDIALKCITLNAAKVIGLDSRLGSIEPGKDADIAVFSGHPLDVRSRCKMTIIDGKMVHYEP
ncbi:MAG: amidohydrolase [Clostridia bacterium]